jgi:hypothetical protein
MTYCAAMTQTPESGTPEHETPPWLTYAWIGLTMVAILVLSSYVVSATLTLIPTVLLLISIIAGAAGVWFLRSDKALGVLLLRGATLLAIVGIVTFQF